MTRNQMLKKVTYSQFNESNGYITLCDIYRYAITTMGKKVVSDEDLYNEIKSCCGGDQLTNFGSGLVNDLETAIKLARLYL